MLQDSLYHHPDTFKLWISNFQSIEGDLWLARLLLLDDRISEAMTILDSAYSRYQLTEMDYFNIQDIKSLVSILDGKPLYNLDSITLNWVESFVDSDGYAGSWARSISSLYGGYYPPEYVITDTTEVYYLEMPAGEQNPLNEFDFMVYPNPANTFVNVEWKHLDFSDHASLLIYDIHGRLVIKQSGLPATGSYTWYPEETVSGVYIFQMEADGKIIKSSKVIISP